MEERVQHELIGSPEVIGQSEAGPRRYALFIAHGMGQQAPFETIDMAARGVVRALGRRFGRSIPAETTVKTKTVRFDLEGGEETLERAEIEVRPLGPQPLGVDRGERNTAEGFDLHLYESYWAPVTEGVVKGWDIVRFLWQGLLSGVRRSAQSVLSGTPIRRWMFGKPVPLEGSSKALGGFVLTGLILFGLLLLNGLAGVIITARLVVGSDPSSWPGNSLMAEMTVIAGFTALLLLTTLLLLLLTRIILSTRESARRRSEGKRVVRRPENRSIGRALWNSLLTSLCWTSGATIAAAGISLSALMLDDLFRTSGERSADPFLQTLTIAQEPLVWFIVWGLLFAASWIVRRKLIEYVGDVVAYLNSTRIDRFSQVRRTIKVRARRLLRGLYSAKERGGAAYYDGVIVMGHSLGSVITYDALNWTINQDLLDGSRDHVVDRTKLFLTFGSPLDKTAFLYSLLTGNTATIRERLATSKQPLITNYAFRRFPWVNVSSPYDIIAGTLENYDTDRTNNPQAIKNKRDPHATTPLVAHVEYWEGEVVFDEVVGVVGR